MDLLEHKTFQVSRGFTYSYYISEPKDPKPTLLLQHGFPDDAHLWSAIVPRLTQYRVIVPDLLGYSGTSKPTDPHAYTYDKLSDDLMEILDAERIDKVVSIGHDFGSLIAQRLYNHHPNRVAALILLNVGYMVEPEIELDLKTINVTTEELFGYPVLSYQELFITDEAPTLLKTHIDRFYQATHGAPVGWMKELWCVKGAMRKWLADERREVDVLDYAQDPAMRRRFIERFQRDGFEGPLCYYKAQASGLQRKAARTLGDDRFIVQVPVLFVVCNQDPVCLPEWCAPAKQGGYLPDLEEVTIDSRHWSPLERPEEVSGQILSFLERRFTS